MITVIGSANSDFTIKTKRLPGIGETISGADFFMAQGGKGANQAAQIAKLGRPVSFVANIGKDYFGDKSVVNLKRLGVNTRFVFRDRFHKSGLAFIIVDGSGRNLIIVSPGSNHYLRVKDLMKAQRLIERSKIILLQLEIPQDVVRKAVNIARQNGVMIILNPAPYRFRLDKKILSKIDILTPNEVEVEAISGIKCRSELSIKRAGAALLKKGVGCVVITRGKKGASVVDKSGFRTHKTRRVKAVDTTCAGDSFNAGLASALYEGRPIDEAVRFANIIASFTVTKMGAQSSLPDLKTVSDYPLARIQV